MSGRNESLKFRVYYPFSIRNILFLGGRCVCAIECLIAVEMPIANQSSMSQRLSVFESPTPHQANGPTSRWGVAYHPLSSPPSK